MRTWGIRLTLRAISQEMLRTANLRLQPHLPGTNELKEFYLQDRSAFESSFHKMACCLLRADSSFLSTEPNHLKTKFSGISKFKYFLINKMPLEMLPANQQPFYSGIYVLTLSDLSQGELKVQWCSIFHGHWYHNTVEPLYNTVHYRRY